MEWLTDPDAWIGLLTLTVLELALGIDNIVFISNRSTEPVKLRARAVDFLNQNVPEVTRLI
jgi:predicted tellurium resistance membrane protein TerC